jgi:hypothetical protein
MATCLMLLFVSCAGTVRSTIHSTTHAGTLIRLKSSCSNAVPFLLPASVSSLPLPPFLFVCVCIRVYACMCPYVCICIYVCTHTHICMYYRHICMNPCTRSLDWSLCARACLVLQNVVDISLPFSTHVHVYAPGHIYLSRDNLLYYT